MRRVARRLALLLCAAGAACSDGVGPSGPDGPALLFSVQAPEAVSAAELDALTAAFDLVDSYEITVRDSATLSILLADTVSVAAGLDEHRFDLALDQDLVGVTVQIDLIGFNGGTELYRSSTFTTVQAVTATSGPASPVVLAVRYTGPGIRGTLTDESGVAQAGVAVGLWQGNTLLTSVSTEADGTYLFLTVTPGSYFIEPTPAPGAYVCPSSRDVTVTSGTPLVADFTTSVTPCQINLLVLSGGDVDDTSLVGEMLSGAPGVVTDVFFYVNQTPGLAVLRRYDVVLVFNNGIFDETTTLGDELAQYVDAGGNVVMGSFYWQARSGSGFGSPGWGALEAYDPFTSKVNPFTGHGGATYAATSLATGSIVAHPLTLNVNAVTSIAGYSAGVTAKSSATVVASWAQGDPMIGYRILGGGQRIVAISLFPGANFPDQVDGDVITLWENAVTWAGAAGGPTP